MATQGYPLQRTESYIVEWYHRKVLSNTLCYYLMLLPYVTHRTALPNVINVLQPVILFVCDGHPGTRWKNNCAISTKILNFFWVLLRRIVRLFKVVCLTMKLDIQCKVYKAERLCFSTERLCAPVAVQWQQERN